MEKIRKEFQEWVESQVWQGEDDFTKNIAVGNVADWWIDKINQTNPLLELIESLAKKYDYFSIESTDKEKIWYVKLGHTIEESYNNNNQYLIDYVGKGKKFMEAINSLPPEE